MSNSLQERLNTAFLIVDKSVELEARGCREYVIRLLGGHGWMTNVQRMLNRLILHACKR